MWSIFVMMILCLVLILCPGNTSVAWDGKAPVWKEDMGEKIIDYHFLQGESIFSSRMEN